MFLVRPELSKPPCEYFTNQTNSFNFTCEANGEPVPNIIWSLDGTRINSPNSSKYMISYSVNGTLATSLLTVMNAQLSDVGVYFCVANNTIGRDERKSAILTVNGKCTTRTFVLILTTH